MMITKQDLIDRFGEEELVETSDRERAQVINDAVVNCAILDAESEIESYLKAVGLTSRNNRGRLIYLDDQTPPKVLTQKACDIARYYLHIDNPNETVQARYDAAIKWLKEVMQKPEMLKGTQNMSEADHNIHVMPNPTPNYWGD